MKLETKRWFNRIILAALVIATVWYVYDYYRMGYHTMPEISEESFPLIFDSGFRAIMEESEDMRYAEGKNRRKYISREAPDVPAYFDDAWSRCKAPTEDEASEIEQSSYAPGPGMRLEAVCKLYADGDTLHTGIIYSVPYL